MVTITRARIIHRTIAMLLSASRASLSITIMIKRGYTLQRLSWHAALFSTFPHHWADQLSSMTWMCTRSPRRWKIHEAFLT